MSGARTGHRAENLAVGAAFTTASFFCAALVGVFAKKAGEFTSPGVILLAQNVICLAIMIPVAVRGGLPFVRTQRIWLHVLRATSGTASWYLLFVAISMIPLANATLLAYSAPLLAYSAPLWLPLLAWAVSRERVATATWLGAGLGFVGVVLVLQPAAGSFDTGSFIALGSAVLLAVAMMAVRWLGSTEPVARILFYFFLMSTVLSVPVALLDWRPFPPQALLWLFAVGAAQMMAQLLIVLAYRYASAEKVGPFIYSVIVFTALIDWLVWDYSPTIYVYLGMALVIGGGLVAVRARAA